MTRRRFPWSRLGIDATNDTAAIRKAYADALRAIDVDADIAGYAELRRARDEALWLAAAHGRAAEAGEEADDCGLGGLDDDGEAVPDAGSECDWLDAVWDEEDRPWDEAAPASRPTAAPDPGLAAAQVEAQTAWARLLAILYPDDAPCEDAMSLAQRDEALAALGVLTARAEAADIAEHDALDSALAELFARTWPRSAPLVEPAAEAFGWLAEAGSLEERPALRFLNQRLKGMRFHAKVQQPDHPLHKAWMQLVQPGPARIVDRLRVKRLEVHKLLTGIRRNFPELESHLDPLRVASWDAAQGEGGVPGVVPRIIRGVFIVLLVLAVPRMISLWSADQEGSLLVTVPAVERSLSPAEADAAVGEIFGAGVGMAEVRRADPKLAPELLAAVTAPEEIPPLNFVRMKAAGAAEVAPRGALEARAQLKALWLAAAAAQGGDACRDITRGALATLSLELSPADRAREQDLLRQLLLAKVLGTMPKGGAVRYAVPPWLVGETIRASGLSQEQLSAALSDPASPDRCKAESALVQAVVKAPGKVPDEVLRGL